MIYSITSSARATPLPSSPAKTRLIGLDVDQDPTRATKLLSPLGEPGEIRNDKAVKNRDIARGA